MPLYRITHRTTYRHDAPASMAWQTLRLRPRDEAGQECLEFELDLSPRAPDLATRTDFFGNTLHAFTLRETHRTFEICATSVVRRELPPAPLLVALTTAETPARLDAAVLAGEFTLEQYRHPTPTLPAPAGLDALLAELADDLPLVRWMAELGDIFARDFTFDPEATDLSTPLDEVLRTRRGVCQDFAQLYLACARHRGLAAAYVSGYLLTHPAPGQARLEGADAMHAWVSLHLPDFGWVDYDPTNHCFVGSEHVVVARGRDYADVCPVRGLFTGGGHHALSLGVTMEPVA